MRRLLAIWLCVWALGGWAADDLEILARGSGPHKPRMPGPDDRNIARIVAVLLERSHYSQRAINAEVSATFLDKYLDALDPQHLLFLQSDLEEFDKYRKTLGDLTRRLGETLPAELIFARFLDRFEQQVAYVTNLLASENFTFDTDERFVFNRRELPRPKDLEEARKLWRDRLRSEYLEEKLNKKSHEEIVKVIQRRYARQSRTLYELDTDEVLQIYLSSLARVYDPHSDYMAKSAFENFNIGMRLSLFGIGAVLTTEDGYCKIMSLQPGSPAEKSGRIKPNDRIVGVAQATNGFVDVVDMKLSKVVELIRGPKDTEVRLEIIPADAADTSVRKVVALVRDEIKMEDQAAKARIIELPAAAGAPPRRIGVLDLPSFYADLENRAADHKSTTTDIAKLLAKLEQEKVEGIILDLRRNGGGALEEAIKLTGLFIKEGPVVQVRDPDGSITVDQDIDSKVLYEGPLVVLTSRFSASASEILAGALQDYGRALVVGDSSTHGKGTVQTVQKLENFLRITNNLGALKFTIRKFYRASGSSTQLKGVTPDIILPSPNNSGEIGEASIPGALPWDTVPAAKYEPVNVVPPLLDELKERSSSRVASDKDFHWLQGEIERVKKLREDKSVSLNEKQRLAEKSEAEARAEARKKDLKSRPEPSEKTYEITLKLADEPGLPPPVAKTNTLASASKPDAKDKPASGKATNASASVAAAMGEEEEAKDEDVPAVDISLEETKRILLDLIELTSKKRDLAAKP